MPGTSFDNPLACTSIPDCVCLLADLIFTVALPIAIIVLMIGAVLLLTSAGDPGRLTQGKTALLWAVIGLTVAIVAAGLPPVIATVLGGSGVPPACNGKPAPAPAPAPAGIEGTDTGGAPIFCYNGIDDDGDGLVDEADPDCVNCHDGIDNDGDGLIDAADPGCNSP